MVVVRIIIIITIASRRRGSSSRSQANKLDKAGETKVGQRERQSLGDDDDVTEQWSEAAAAA